jgi:hypothetical protein
MHRYTNTFNVANSGEGAAAGRRLTNTQKIAFGCFRPAGTPLSTTANQKLFGAQFPIDGSTSLESGLGTCGGCAVGWNRVELVHAQRAQRRLGDRAHRPVTGEQLRRRQYGRCAMRRRPHQEAHLGTAEVDVSMTGMDRRQQRPLPIAGVVVVLDRADSS